MQLLFRGPFQSCPRGPRAPENKTKHAEFFDTEPSILAVEHNKVQKNTDEEMCEQLAFLTWQLISPVSKLIRTDKYRQPSLSSRQLSGFPK